MTVVAEARGVTKRFATRVGATGLLDPFELTLSAGSVTGLVGPSLSGKTTAVTLLAGWELPDTGRVTWPASRQEPPTWEFLTVIPQGFALLDELTVEENVLFASRVGKIAVSKEQYLDVTGALGLDHLRHRFVTEISVGERQRTMVARALTTEARCILADEPVAHQDERNARVVLDLLRRAADGGMACLVVSRDHATVARIADDIMTVGADRRLDRSGDTTSVSDAGVDR